MADIPGCSENGVVTSINDQILEICIDRPPANAISRAVSRDLYAAFKFLDDQPYLRLAILTAGGERIFSGGWDLKAVSNEGYEPQTEYDPIIGHGPGGFAGLTRFHDLGKPVIVAVNGAAVGGGMELCLACDVIVMSDSAWFMLPETRRGLIPDGGGVQRLAKMIPANVAREFMLTGRPMLADEARHWGLACDVVPPASLMQRTREIANDIIAGAPLAIAALKETMAWADGKAVDELMRQLIPGVAALPGYQAMHDSEDIREGIDAFAEKREPQWKGR